MAPLSPRRRQLEDDGFTLIEMIVALLILAIVLAATAPAFYSTLKATSTTNFRSVANGIAVQADEQLRSLPYYEIGYRYFPGSCTAPSGYAPGTTAPVILTNAGPMDSTSLFPLSRTVDQRQFSIQRCVYWVDDTIGITSYAGAYMATHVTVSWTDQTGTQSVSQSSVIYPGGEGAYSGGENSFPPQTVPSTSGATPTQPTAVTFGTIRDNSIPVSWTKPTTATKSTNYTYLVEYNTTGTFNITQVPNGLYAYVSTTSTSATVSGLSPGTRYYFQVVAVNQGSPPAPSSIVYTATTGTPDSSGTCTIYSMTVNPAQAQIDTYGYLQGQSFFTVGMNVSPGCTNGNSSVWAYYPTTGSTLQSLQMSGSGPMLVGAAGLNSDGSQMPWTPGNKTFTAYTATGASSPTQYSQNTFVQVNICQPSPVTGTC